MKRLYAVVANNVQIRDSISYIFMFDSKAPFDEFADIADQYGFLVLGPKPDDFINPFRLARGEDKAIGDDGIPQWRFCVGNHNGMRQSGSIDLSTEVDTLYELLDDAPDCTLLINTPALEHLKSTCERHGIQFNYHLYDGDLATAH